MSNFTLHRNTNDESYIDPVDEATDTKRESGNKEWEDGKMFALRDTYSGIEQLLNCKHPKYHLRDENMKSLEKRKGIIHENEIEVAMK